MALAVALVSIPPLTAEQQVRLQTARDGRDHREEAFVALVENVWSGRWEIGGHPVVLHPDHDAMMADPAAHRGVVCRIEGVVQQATGLERPHDGITEWFVRDDEGRPILVYVVHPEPTEQVPDAPRLGERDRVEIFARFYKPIDDAARDGVTRTYPAYVGAAPRRTATQLPPVTALPLRVIALPVGGMLVVFMALLMYTRRQRRGDAPVRRSRFDAPPPEPDSPLPDDPADALAEMKRRSDA